MQVMATSKGPRNDISDVPGIRVGSTEDAKAKTGVTVILPERAMTVAGDIRGGGPGARETDLLDPSTLVERADAIVLSGGSSYGLAAADGATAWLGAKGRGFSLVNMPGVPPSPIVPAAILYDLANGGDKNWGERPPYAALGRAACENASADPVLLGKAGAGFGATAGAGAGGLGSASYQMPDGLIIGALVAVNSFGSPFLPGTDVFWAWPFEEDGEFGGARPAPDWAPTPDLPPDTKLAGAIASGDKSGSPDAMDSLAVAPAQRKTGFHFFARRSGARANTTIGVVAVSAALTKAQARRVAIMAQDGLARAIRPIHGPTDGDALFVLAAGEGPSPDPLALTRIGLLAADCLSRAIARGVYEARRPG